MLVNFTWSNFIILICLHHWLGLGLGVGPNLLAHYERKGCSNPNPEVIWYHRCVCFDLTVLISPLLNIES